MKKTIKNHILSAATVAVFTLFFVGSATEKKIAAVPIKVPTYTITPPSTAPAKSAKIAFLLINPRYARTFRYSTVKLFSDFANSMSADFNQALTAKGYSVRGPYPTYDDVIYTDKKETDLMLQVEILLDINEANVHYTQHQVGLGQYTTYNYTYEGTVILSGKINLIASETMTQEKLWAKSIPLEQKQITVASIYNYPTPNEFLSALNRDAGIVNPMVDVLEDFYKSLFKTSWNHLDPSELTPLKAQVDEIRAKSGMLQH